MEAKRGDERGRERVKISTLPGITRIYEKIPLDRIGVLIGHEGRVKKELMKRTRTRISIDSDNGVAVIEPESPDVPPINLLKARDFIRAIAYGFPPEKALRLLDEDQILIVIDLKQYVGPHPNHMARIKGRIIGEKGKARKNIEEMTGTYISIHDTYVAIIGDYESATAAREAIEMLIQGRQHSTVYKYLDRIMTRIKKQKLQQLWQKPF